MSKFQKLKNRMELSMLSAVPYFLRIGDAANGDIDGQFNSDVYIIGNYYYPASYLIAKAYYSVTKNYAKTKQLNKLITIDGSFPDYAQKYVSVKHGTRYY